MLRLIGVLLFFGGIFLALWLGFYIMLYGGVMLAIDNWGVDTASVVWGIIMAVFFKLGLVAGGIVCFIGISMAAYGD